MTADTFAMIPTWLLRRTDVPATAKLLYARLLQYRGSNADAWPSIGTLAVEIGSCRRSINENLAALDRLNLLRVDQRAGYRGCHRYNLLTPTSAESALVTSAENALVQNLHVTSAESALSLVQNLPVTSAESARKDISKRSYKRSNKRTSPVAIPAVLNTSRFSEAWTEFQEHRCQLRKSLTPLAAKKQLAILEAIGPERAIAAINHSIAQGWQSIHEPTRSNNGKSDRSGRINSTPNKYDDHGLVAT